MTSGSLWNYYKDKVNDDANESNGVGNYRISNNKTTTSKSFKNKTKIIGNTAANINMPLVEIKDFNALIDNKPFFDQPVKNKQEPYQKLIEMSRNNDYTTGNVLDYHIIKIIINLLA